jgi:hypothetical protein
MYKSKIAVANGLKNKKDFLVTSFYLLARNFAHFTRNTKFKLSLVCRNYEPWSGKPGRNEVHSL